MGDFACKALSDYGLALTLGGPGSSWCRSGGGFLPVTDAKVKILDKAEAVAHMPWGYRRASNLPFFIAADTVCHTSRAWPARRRTLVITEPKKKRGTRRRRREAEAIEISADADMPDLVAIPRV